MCIATGTATRSAAVYGLRPELLIWFNLFTGPRYEEQRDSRLDLPRYRLESGFKFIMSVNITGGRIRGAGEAAERLEEEREKESRNIRAGIRNRARFFEERDSRTAAVFTTVQDIGYKMGVAL